MDKAEERKQATQLYRDLPKDAQMYFNALMNLAAVLFKVAADNGHSE